MSETIISREMVNDRLRFAECRLADLLALNGGNLFSADSSSRQQLVQEFFFHLVGATEILANLVNQERELGIGPDRVTIPRVLKALGAGDLETHLSSLYASVAEEPLPSNPYTDEAYIFRIRNYRHQVSHRATNPFLFNVVMGGPYTIHLLLDPRDPNTKGSDKPAAEEMQYMLTLVKKRCTDTLTSL